MHRKGSDGIWHFVKEKQKQENSWGSKRGTRERRYAEWLFWWGAINGCEWLFWWGDRNGWRPRDVTGAVRVSGVWGDSQDGTQRVREKNCRGCMGRRKSCGRAGQEIGKKRRKKEKKTKETNLNGVILLFNQGCQRCWRTVKAEEIAFSSREGSWVNISV